MSKSPKFTKVFSKSNSIFIQNLTKHKFVFFYLDWLTCDSIFTLLSPKNNFLKNF